jgi:hypothetical protein
VTHACNPAYSRGRDQEDCSTQSAWANSLRNSISKKPLTKKAGGMAEGVGLEFKPQSLQKRDRDRQTERERCTLFSSPIVNVLFNDRFPNFSFNKWSGVFRLTSSFIGNRKFLILLLQ